MSPINDVKQEVINPPVLFDKNNIEDSKLKLIEMYYKAYLTFGTGASYILIPEKVSYLKDSNWRHYCNVPTKWEPIVCVEPKVDNIFILNPLKEVYVVPVVLPLTGAEIPLGFILGDIRKLNNAGSK